jgi:hypothetical protein
MEDSITRKLKLAYDKYLAGFLANKPERMAELAGADFSDGFLFIDHFGEKIAVNPTSGEMTPKPQQLLEEILVLKYLQESQGMFGPGKDYISFVQLPFGFHHSKAFKAEVTDYLAKQFGHDFDSFQMAAEHLGGVAAKDGDISYVLPFFPKIYVKVILWAADDEFPSASNFLFDHKCTFQMDTDGLNELANATVARLVMEAKK